MIENWNATGIIRTKLNRPPVPLDHVYRARLIERLREYSHRPAALISAPAGYGKSTLASCWLDRCECPGAWLSLDENDNDLHTFLGYFVAAIGGLIPEAFGKTDSLSNAPALPHASVIAGHLANQLDAIAKDFILVLDDIHLIRDKSIHDFLDTLMRHPPRCMHLVLIGRRDPFISISRLRARGQIGEIRLHDLMFSVSETTAYLQQIIETPVEESTAAGWSEKMEGWITGLRLAALSLKHLGLQDCTGLKLEGGSQYVTEYLFSEVVAHQPPAIRDGMLKISILQRFSASLCHAVCAPDDAPDAPSEKAWAFIRHLSRENLFLINLDSEKQWFRFHHYFRQLLHNQLRKHYPPEDIAALHHRASEWFEARGLISESIDHALLAGDSDHAADIIESNRYPALEADRWSALGRWLERLPPEIIQRRPGLLLAQTWVFVFDFKYDLIAANIERIEACIDTASAEIKVIAELNFFRAYLAYALGDGAGACRFSAQAQGVFPKQPGMIAGEVLFYHALALQMVGDSDAAIEMVAREKNEPSALLGDLYLTRVFGVESIIHLMDGRLPAAASAASQLITVSQRCHANHALAWGHYLQALQHFHGHRLERSRRHFVAVRKQQHWFEPRANADALAGLSLTYALMQRPEDARNTLEKLVEFSRSLQDPLVDAVAASSRVRVALLQGAPELAFDLANSLTGQAHPPDLFLWLEEPSMTRARAQIVVGGEENLRQALDTLDGLQQQSETRHLTCQAIDVAVLRSMALKKMNRSNRALQILADALSLAAPGGWIRPFMEAGAPLTDQLKRLQMRHVETGFIGRLLDVSPETVPAKASDARGHQCPPHGVVQHPNLDHRRSLYLIDPLTNRELDIIDLLAQRLQNKEIADNLSISPKTVKTHLRNIYQKLNVANRREAVQMASRMSLV